MKTIIWRNETRKLSQLKEWSKNPRRIADLKFEKLVDQISKKGFTQPIVINTDNTIIAGHQRRKALLQLHGPGHEVEVRVPDRKLTKAEFEELALGDNLFTGEFDIERLSANFSVDDLLNKGFQRWELGSLTNDLQGLLPKREASTDAGTEEGEPGTVTAIAVAGVPADNEPTQEEYEAGAPPEEETGPVPEKEMPFEIMLRLSTRRRLIDYLATVKEKQALNTHDAAINHLLDTAEK